MSEQIKLTAELRADKGKGASRRLRRLENKVPAVIYGGQQEPQALSLKDNELINAMRNEAFFSQVIELSVDGKEEPVVVRDMQRHPATEKVAHIDFLRIDANVSINVSVPLHFINEESCVGVKISGGTLTHNLTEVEISCLPDALPEFIEVDMQDLEAGSSVHLSDLVIPEGVTIVALSFGEDRDIPVASVTARKGGGKDEGDESADDGEAAADGEAEE